MTWKELKKQIEHLTDEQMNTDVTVYSPADIEFYPILNNLKIDKESDVLDENHPFIVIAS